MDCEQLLKDRWFSALHKRAASNGFGGTSTTPEGNEGWFLDPCHLIEHIQENGVELRWAFCPEDRNACNLMAMAIDIMAHCQDVLTAAHSFVGGFATKQATFLMFSDEAVFGDGQQHLSLAFCVPDDALASNLIEVPTTVHSSPWVDEAGMADCMEMRDIHENLPLLSIGMIGRGRDLHTIFKPHHENMEQARAFAQRDTLAIQTITTNCDETRINRL